MGKTLMLVFIPWISLNCILKSSFPFLFFKVKEKIYLFKLFSLYYLSAILRLWLMDCCWRYVRIELSDLFGKQLAFSSLSSSALVSTQHHSCNPLWDTLQRNGFYKAIPLYTDVLFSQCWQIPVANKALCQNDIYL